MKQKHIDNLNKRGNFVKRNAETAMTKMNIIEEIVQRQKKKSLMVGQVQDRKNNIDVVDRENKLQAIKRR